MSSVASGLSWVAWAMTCFAFPLVAGFVPGPVQDLGKDSLPYQLASPANLEPGAKYPLVVFFHGAGERGQDNKAQLKHGTSLYLEPDHQKKYPCFVLAPQCPKGQQWVDMPWGADSGVRPDQPSHAMQKALVLIREIATNLPVDTNRIYVTGLSMGGYATWDCVTRFPGQFAAGAPVCGGGDESTVNDSVAKVPVWAFHSDDDKVVKAIRSRNMIEAMRQKGGNPKYSEYSGLGHFSWGKAYSEPEFLSWMFSQRLGQPDQYGLRQ